MRLKYTEVYGHEGVCDIKKYNNIIICTHDKECAATGVKGSAESLMEYVIKRFDLDVTTLRWVTYDPWKKANHYQEIIFKYEDGKVDRRKGLPITIEELNEMIRKSGDFIQ